MSAIWGLVSYEQTIPENITELFEAPYKEKCRIDAYRHISTPQAVFGCGIQYITKEAHHEVLPIYDEKNGYLFTADCLLDNRGELIQELSVDASLSDGALMYQAFLKWGTDCFVHFRGLFSVAVYDYNKQSLILASDPLVCRCLYYTRTETGVIFSTLLAPILSVEPSLSYNELYLKDFLTAPGMIPNVVANETPYAGVYKLTQGMYLTITPTAISSKRYRTPDMPMTSIHAKTAKQYGKAFRKIYEDCIRDAIRTEGEVGIALSSGLDSSSAAALAAVELAKDNKTLYSHTYIPYEELPKDKDVHAIHNETADVQKIVAMHPNIKASFVNNDGKNCLEDQNEIMKIMEIPYKAYVNLPNLCEIYRKSAALGCKVVLTGQVGNSTVSNGRIDNILFDLYKDKHYLSFLLYLNNCAKGRKESRKKALYSSVSFLRKHPDEERYDFSGYQPDNPFLSDTILEDYPLVSRFESASLHYFSQYVSQEMYRHMLTEGNSYPYLGELDTKMGLYHGIVIRDPTRDPRLMSFCYALPYRYFAYNGTPRWLIRGNLRDILPPSILDDWMRHGQQNSDYYLRIQRDWSSLSPAMQKVFTYDEKDPYFSSDAIDSFLKECDNSPEENRALRFHYLAYSYVFKLFLSLQ